MKQTIRLNESDLNRLVKVSVKRVLKENYLGKSWEETLTSPNFWSNTPDEIHKMLLKRGYCVGMPKNEVMELIEWARAMFFLPIELPHYTENSILNIIISHLRGNTFEPNDIGFGQHTKLKDGTIYQKNN